MSKMQEMSKTTLERIESVFNEFVVNKLIDEFEPIKKDFKRSDLLYEDKTTREFIENIYQSVSDMESSVNKMKKSVIHQDPTWKMSDQIQSIVYSQSDITDDIENINENVSILKDDISVQLSARSDDINKNIENAVNVLVAKNEKETTNIITQLQGLCENIQTLSSCLKKDLNSFAEANQEKVNVAFDTVTKIIKDSNIEYSQAINKYSESLNERFDKVESTLESLNDLINQNALSIKDEITKTSDTTIQSISESVSNIGNISTQNTSELKAHIRDVLAEYETKMNDINASNTKNINMMFKILIGISATNAVGIITAIILNLIF